MEKQTITNSLGSIEGYVVEGNSIIPTKYLTAFDEKHLAAAATLAEYTMPNAMTADVYYENLIVDATEQIFAAASAGGSLHFTGSDAIPAAEAVTIDVPLTKGQVESVGVTFFDETGAIIGAGVATGTVAIDATGASGNTSNVGSADAAAPTAAIAIDEVYTQLTFTPDTLTGVDHYKVVVAQTKCK